MSSKTIKPTARVRELKRQQLQMAAQHNEFVRQRTELSRAEKRGVVLLKLGMVAVPALCFALGVVVGWSVWG